MAKCICRFPLCVAPIACRVRCLDCPAQRRIEHLFLVACSVVLCPLCRADEMVRLRVDDSFFYLRSYVQAHADYIAFYPFIAWLLAFLPFSISGGLGFFRKRFVAMHSRKTAFFWHNIGLNNRNVYGTKAWRRTGPPKPVFTFRKICQCADFLWALYLENDLAAKFGLFLSISRQPARLASHRISNCTCIHYSPGN